MTTIELKRGREASVERRHPWVFSGAIANIEGSVAPGDTVSVVAHDGRPLGVGHYHDGSITVRLLAFFTKELPDNFWADKLESAWQLRQRIGLPSEATTMFRLVHGEGDELPGLIVDVYGDTAVVQFHDLGMHRNREAISAAIMGLTGGPVQRVYDKSSETLHFFHGKYENGYLAGEAGEGVGIENGHAFSIDWEGGQKTGFYLDQRENRALLGVYARDRSVLNAFSYSGGFSVYALANGAARVASMDASQPALDLAGANVARLGKEMSARHELIKADVPKYLKEVEVGAYDMIVLDPPAFAKRVSARHGAIQAYRRLNAEAMRKLPKGGLLFTFSCSQVITRAIFEDTILAAALEVNRPVRVLHRMTQGPDHPVNIFHPESEYLKGLVLQVEG